MKWKCFSLLWNSCCMWRYEGFIVCLSLKCLRGLRKNFWKFRKEATISLFKKNNIFSLYCIFWFPYYTLLSYSSDDSLFVKEFWELQIYIVGQVCWKFKGKKYELAKKFGTLIVNHQWLDDCIKKGKLVPESPYTMQR